MKKILLFMVLPVLYLSAVEKDFILGSDNWQPYTLENIEFTKNQAGETGFGIKDGEYTSDSLTELLLHFNDASSADSAGNFIIKENKAAISSGRKKYGAGAGLFNGEREAIVLERRTRMQAGSADDTGNGLFPGRIYSGDFSIEFWIYGRNFSDSETIFLFDSYTNRGGNFIPQFFKCYLEDRKLIWHIKNFFLPAENEQFELKISGNKRLVPGKWSHHLLRYSSDNGLMEYLVDGLPDAAVHVNRDAEETGEYYPFYSGEKGRIVIGDKFTGLMDEFRLRLAWVNDYRLEKYRNYSGTYISDQIDLGHSKSSVFSIETRHLSPPGTDVHFFYYFDDFNRIPSGNSPEWTRFVPGFFNAGGGRFLRIMAVLYSDGEREYSPFISQIRIRYDQKTPPPPPQTVRAESGNGRIRLKWTEVADPDLDGYYVYFGERPGKYFGAIAGSVSSPVDAGKNNEIIIENLENGRIYYFSVVSYCKTASRFGSSIINEGGRYSSEVNARPSENASRPGAAR